jgi:hypothetical protein
MRARPTLAGVTVVAPGGAVVVVVPPDPPAGGAAPTTPASRPTWPGNEIVASENHTLPRVSGATATG